MSLLRAHGYVGHAQTTLNRVGRSPIPAAWLPRIQAQSPGEDRSLVLGLAPDPTRPPHLLLMAPEDVAEALAVLERGTHDPINSALWRRFNRRAVQIARDGSDRVVVPAVLREAAGLSSGPLHWLGDRNKLRIFSAENWALFSEIEDSETDLDDATLLAAMRGRSGGLL